MKRDAIVRNFHLSHEDDALINQIAEKTRQSRSNAVTHAVRLLAASLENIEGVRIQIIEVSPLTAEEAKPDGR